MHNLKKRILVSITGKTAGELKNKIKELEELRIKKAALFITFLSKKKQREEVYDFLLSSKIKKIPIVHIRDELDKSELEFLQKNFKTKFFTIHEKSFRFLKKWNKFHRKLILELDYNNNIPKKVKIKKIRGFCIDLSHFKSSQERLTKEFYYILKKRKKAFIANHLNGYSKKGKHDLHTIKNLKEFDYIKTLPKFIFGRYILLETFNSIKEQLKFKKYLCKFLKNY